MKSNLYKKDLISAKYAGEISGYTSRYLRKLARQGDIVGVQVGNVWMVKRGSLVKFLDLQSKRKEELSLVRSRIHSEVYKAHASKNVPEKKQAIAAAASVPAVESVAPTASMRALEVPPSQTLPVRIKWFRTHGPVIAAAVLLSIIGSHAMQDISAAKLKDNAIAAVAATGAVTTSALSVGERAALATYEAIHGIIDTTGGALAFIFSPMPVVVPPNYPEPKPVIALAATTTPPASVPVAATPKPAITSPSIVVSSPSYPTYTTVVEGISQTVLNQSLASLRTSILATVSGMVAPIAQQSVTNMTTIQQVNMIQDLTDLTVHNGKFLGGVFDGATRVSATDGGFTNLSASNFTAGTTNLGDTAVSGSLGINGPFFAYTSASAPYFVATSTTATSTFAGGLAVGGSKFVVDSTTGHVGIGNANPSYQLQIGNGAFLDGRVNLSGSQPFLRIEDTDSTGPYATNWILQAYLGRLRLLGGTAGEVLSIASSTGFIGIGTTSPSSALSVTGDLTLTGSTTISGNDKGIIFTGSGNHDITAGNGTLRIGSNTIIGNIQALDSTVSIGTPGTRFNKIYANEVNASTIVGTLTGGNLTAETFSINSDNVSPDQENSFLAFARGSVSPNALLWWDAATSSKRFTMNMPLFIQSGDASTTNPTVTIKSVGGQTADILKIASSSGSNLLNVSAMGNLAVNPVASNGSVPGLTIYGNYTNAANNEQLNIGQISGDRFQIWTTAIGSGSGRRIQIDAGGPSVQLSTNGGGVRFQVDSTNATVTDNLIFNTDNTYDIGASTGSRPRNLYLANTLGIGTTSPWAQLSVNPNGVTGPEFAIGSSTKTDFVVTNGGAVGIGTTSPATIGSQISLFAVAGYSNLNNLRINGGDSANTILQSSGNLNINTSGGTLGLGTSVSTETLTILSTGNVGIGETSPGNVLSLKSNASFGLNVDLNATAAGGRWYQIGSTANTNGVGSGLFSIYDNTSSASRLVINSSGNVGIGTTTPAAVFSLQGRNGVNPFVVASSSGTSLLSILSDGSINLAGDRSTSAVAGGAINITGGDGVTSGLIFSQGGSVNVTSGTGFNPGAGGAMGNVVISTPGTPTTNITGGNITLQTGSTATGNNGSLIFQTSGANTRMIIDKLGNVGIGTTSPYSMLSVAGQIVGQNFVATSTTATSTFASAVRIGTLTAPSIAASAKLHVFTDTPGIAGLIVQRGVNNLTGSLQQWVDHDGVVQAQIGFDGRFSTSLISGNGTGGGLTLLEGSAGGVLTAGSFGRIKLVTDTNNTVVFDSGTSLPTIIQGYNTSGSIYTNLQLQPNGGNVGIGTTSPSQTLSVNGNSYFTGTVGIGTSGSIGALTGSAVPLAVNIGSGVISIGDFGEAIGISSGTIKGEFGVRNQAPDAYIYAGTMSNNDFVIRTNNTDKVRFLAGGNVGIGTTSPLFDGNGTLHVAIEGATNLFADFGLGTNQTSLTGALGALAFYNSNISGSEKRNASIVGLNDGALNSGAIAFNTATGGTISEKVRIINSGNVGIGTTSPYAALSVVGATGVVAQMFTATSTTATSTFAGGLSTQGMAILGSGGSNVQIGSSDRFDFSAGPTSILTINNPNSNQLGINLSTSGSQNAFLEFSRSSTVQWGLGLPFSTANDFVISRGAAPAQDSSAAFTILSSNGNVGIGTTSPTARFSVAFSQSITNPLTSGSNGIRIQNTDASSGNVLGGLEFYSWDNLLKSGVYSVRLNDGGAGESGDLRFATRFNDAGGILERMRITPAGNVGIGTTTPTSILHVYATQPNVRIESSNGLSNDQTSLDFANAAGTFRIGRDTSGSGALFASGGALSNAAELGTRESTPLQFFTNDRARMIVDSSGNVGIGTTSPQNLLSVYGGNANAFIDINSINGQTGIVFQRDSVNRFKIYNQPNSATSYTLNIVSSNTGTGLALDYATGNVGIGTSTPANQLTMTGNFQQYYDNVTNYKSVARSAGIIGLLGDSNDYFINYDTANERVKIGGGAANAGLSKFGVLGNAAIGSDYVETVAAPTNGLIVEGNVGIGTTSPYAQLSISNSATTPANGTLFAIASTTAGTSTSTLMAVLANGNVGIGTSSPMSRFSVSDADNLGTILNSGSYYASYGTFSPTITLNSSDVSNVRPNFIAASQAFTLNNVSISGGIGSGSHTLKEYNFYGSQTSVSGSPIINTTSDVRFNAYGSYASSNVTPVLTAVAAQNRVQDYAGYFTNTSNYGTGAFSLVQTFGVSAVNTSVAYAPGSLAYGGFFDVSGATASTTYGVFISGPSAGLAQHYSLYSAGAAPSYFAGNVGIGTTSPWGQLSVNPDGISGPAFVIGSSSATNFIVTNGGNVGMGTTTPQDKLSILMNGSTNQDGVTVTAVNSGGTGSQPGIRFNKPDTTKIYSVAADVTSDILLFVPRSGTTAAVFNQLGNFGMGTATPTLGKLEINAGTGGTSNMAGYFYGSTSNGSFSDEAGRNRTLATLTVGSNWATSAGNVLNVSSAAGDALLFVRADGNVGIGTASPGAQLNIKGGASPEVARFEGTSGNPYVTFNTGGEIARITGRGDLSNSLEITSDGVSTAVFNNGRIGIGTTTPSALLDVYKSSGVSGIDITSNSAGVGDAARIRFLTPSHMYGLVTESVNGTSIPSGFGLFDYNATAFRWTVTSGGNFGIATTSPATTFTVSRTTTGYISQLDSVGNQPDFMNFTNSSVTSGSITRNGASAVLFNTTSDRRLKENIATTTLGLNTLLAIPVRDFNFIAEPGHTVQGFVAQELYSLYPDAVHVGGADPSTNPWGVDYGRVTPLIISSIQDLNAKFESRTSFIQSATTSPIVIVDVSGNVGIGTTTPNHTLTVNGDVGAIAFVNTSTRALKMDVNYVDASSTEDMYNRLKQLKVATYRYRIEEESNPLRLGFIAEDAQTIAPEILSPDGKGVDLYKLATFTLAGVQTLAAKVDAHETRIASLEARVAMLESGAVATGTGTPMSFASTTAQLTTWFASASNGIGEMLAKTFRASEKICVDDQCLTKDDVRSLLALVRAPSALGSTTTPGIVITDGGATSTPPVLDTASSTPSTPLMTATTTAPITITEVPFADTSTTTPPETAPIIIMDTAATTTAP